MMIMITEGQSEDQNFPYQTHAWGTQFTPNSQVTRLKIFKTVSEYLKKKGKDNAA